MLSPSKRWKHFAAMVLIGDGVMALVHPQHDTDAWNAGPHWWCRLMRSLHDRPALTRAIGIAQIAGGICWALSQQHTEEDSHRDLLAHNGTEH